MRYNSGAVVLPKHARRLPGMMQTVNMEKQGCTTPCRIIAQTFGLFREGLGCTRSQRRGNGRFCGFRGMSRPQHPSRPAPLLCRAAHCPLVRPALLHPAPPIARPRPRPCTHCLPVPPRPLACPCHPPVPTFSISRKFAPCARVRPYSSGLRRGDKGICASETS